MRWYFIARFATAIAFLFAYGKGNLAWDIIIAILLLIDFLIFPIIYLIYSFVRKKNLAPGEYRVKPEGKRM